MRFDIKYRFQLKTLQEPVLDLKKKKNQRLSFFPSYFRQILFISVEQLSLNVAGDWAETLSVLGNTRGPFRTPLQNYS